MDRPHRSFTPFVPPSRHRLRAFGSCWSTTHEIARRGIADRSTRCSRALIVPLLGSDARQFVAPRTKLHSWCLTMTRGATVPQLHVAVKAEPGPPQGS
jgi:hypothetical protein